MESILRDIRYSLRLLGRSPGFAATAILTLAIGIGATTAIFTLVNRAFLQALPIARPEQVIALSSVAPNRTLPTTSYPDYRDIRDRAGVFSGLAGYNYAMLSVSHDGINERLWGSLVTGNYFDVLGVRAAVGRTIAPEDDQVRGGHPVTVVSHRYWQQRFGGASDVVGRSIVVNGRTYTIIGVTPQGFFGTDVASAPDFWFPLAMQAQVEVGRPWLENRGAENLFVVGRLKPDVTARQASAALETIAAQLESENRDGVTGRRIMVTAPGLYGSAMRAPVIGFMALLLIICALVLVLACTNLANLLLARAAERRREIAVRLSLGGGRRALVRQLLTESVLLSALAGVLGLLLAFWLVGLLVAIKLPVDLPMTLNLQIEGRVLLFNIALSLLTGVLFGIVPALQATKADLVTALKSGATAGDRHDSAWKNTLLVLQVAVSLVLLVGGGLMLRAMARAQSMPLGFTPEQAIEVSFDLRLQGYSEERGREFQAALLERVRALPGVRHAALADMIPVDLHFGRARVYPEGAPEREGRAPVSFVNRVSPGYFQAMNTRIEQGRDFTTFDDPRAPLVAIVNRALTRRLWPGEDPLGRRFRIGAQDAPVLQVIGVAQDGKYASFGENGQAMVYLPLLQRYSGATTVIARGNGNPSELISRVRREVLLLDPQIPIGSARTLVERLALPLLPARITAWMFGIFGALALVLAAIGLYGVMSYMVSTRTHEIGVRMALGARSADVLRLVLRQGLTLTAIGVLAGVAGAAVVTRLMRALLFGVSSTDVLTYGAVVVLLGLVALVACFVPARRATKLDPLVALRAE